MMALKSIAPTLTEDQKVKTSAAVNQMNKLIGKLDQWVKYRLLTPQDRQNLKEEGFASDLVDNLAYFTQRPDSDLLSKANDLFITGFTSAAFDPSLYACPAIEDALKQSSDGRCAWCESRLDTTGGMISHYRPPAGYRDDDGILQRKAYYALAYEPDNLMYTCQQCAEHYKTDQFPVIGTSRMPEVGIHEESPVLINPYKEDPRNSIRFNPLNAQAYPYDRVSAFYQDTHHMSASDVQTMIWQHPAQIPDQSSPAGAISSTDLDKKYRSWLNNLPALRSEMLMRGMTTINAVGLNRPTLIDARARHLILARGFYVAGKAKDPRFTLDSAAVNKLIDELISGTSGFLNEYVSISIDAMQTWRLEDAA